MRAIYLSSIPLRDPLKIIRLIEVHSHVDDKNTNLQDAANVSSCKKEDNSPNAHLKLLKIFCHNQFEISLPPFSRISLK